MQNAIREFNEIRDSLNNQKVSYMRGDFTRKSKLFRFDEVEVTDYNIVFNQSFVLSGKSTKKLTRLLNFNSPAELAKFLMRQEFKLFIAGQLALVWFSFPTFTIAFLKNNYERSYQADLITGEHKLEVFLADVFCAPLNSDIVALSQIVKPSKLAESKEFDRYSAHLYYLRTVVNLFKDAPDLEEFCSREGQCITFNSKLLTLDGDPIVVKARMTPSNALRGFDIVEQSIPPYIQQTHISNERLKSLVIDVDGRACSHLTKTKYKDAMPSSSVNIREYISECLGKTLAVSEYYASSIKVIRYQKYNSLAVSLGEGKDFYAVGQFPKKKTFSVRTLLRSDIVNLNSLVISPLY